MVSKPIRLNNLVRLAVMAAHYAYRILNGNLGTIRVHKPHEKVNASLLPPISAFLCEMPRPGHGQVGAWRKRDNHVPFFGQQRCHVLLQMPFGMSTAALLYIAGIRLMTSRSERLADLLAFLTRY